MAQTNEATKAIHLNQFWCIRQLKSAVSHEMFGLQLMKCGRVHQRRKFQDIFPARFVSQCTLSTVVRWKPLKPHDARRWQSARRSRRKHAKFVFHLDTLIYFKLHSISEMRWKGVKRRERGEVKKITAIYTCCWYRWLPPWIIHWCVFAWKFIVALKRAATIIRMVVECLQPLQNMCNENCLICAQSGNFPNI